MKPDTILKADLLDIIFENKNKNYGACTLRKYYHERLYKALGIIFLATAILTLIGVFYKNKEANVICPLIPEVVLVNTYEIDKPKIPKTAVLLPPHTNISASTQIKKAINNNSSANIKLTTDADLIPPSVPEGMGYRLQGDGLPVSVAGFTSPLPPSVGTDQVNGIDKATPVSADIMPTFPGGIEALKKFLKKNLSIPKDLDREETISVKVQFIVGYDGELKGFKVIEDGGNVFNDEVIRVLKKMPAWIPGKAHGENVSVYYTPVMFTSVE